MSMSVELDDHVRKQIVITCLTDFFREFDARQLPLVENTFIENSRDISSLLQSLLKRYPRAPRDRFDDVISTLRGLDNSSQTQRATKGAQSTMRSKHAQVQELLREGAALLAAPAPADYGDNGNSHRDDDTQSRQSGTSASYLGASQSMYANSDDPMEVEATSNGHRDDLQTLKQLIDDNRRLAQEVAAAEQQVLQKRFEMKYIKLVVAPSDRTSSIGSAAAPSHVSSTSLTNDAPSVAMIVVDGDRQFEVTCTDAEMTYMQQGPLDAPWSLDESDHCFVHFNSLEGSSNHLNAKKQSTVGIRGGLSGVEHAEPSKVMRTVVAMAMRVWSRRHPHTVTERLASGEVTTHTSSILWWQWPSPCEGQRGVAPESLLHIHGLLDGVDCALQRVDDEMRAASYAARRVTPLHDEVCHLLTGTPSDLGGHLTSVDSSSPDRRDTFWQYFIHQYGALSRSQNVPEMGLPFDA
jgi:hypothetical protein